MIEGSFGVSVQTELGFVDFSNKNSPGSEKPHKAQLVRDKWVMEV
jgi:hypothetical protein